MNKISINNAYITKIKTFSTQKGPGLDVEIRDKVGPRKVFFLLVFYDDAALRVQGHLSEGDYIDVTGNLWVRPHDGHFDMILDNPLNIYNHTRCVSVDSAGNMGLSVQSKKPEVEDDGLPF